MGSPRDRLESWNPKFPHAQSFGRVERDERGIVSDEAEQTAARGETPLVREREPAEHERLRVFLAESEEGIVRGVPEVQTEAREEGKEGDARQYHSRARGGQQPFSSTRGSEDTSRRMRSLGRGNFMGRPGAAVDAREPKRTARTRTILRSGPAVT